jgi:hypothetical protein
MKVFFGASICFLLVAHAAAQRLVPDLNPPRDEVEVLRKYMRKHGPNKLMEANAISYTFDQQSLTGIRLWSLDVGSGLVIAQWVLTSGEGKTLKVVKDYGCTVSTLYSAPALYVEKRGLIIKMPHSQMGGGKPSKLLVIGKIP